jgi:uncharacterized protein YpmS
MKNYEKIQSLREKLNAILDPKIKEYVEAELDYSSEIANGYSMVDQMKAEDRLIVAMKSLGVHDV